MRGRYFVLLALAACGGTEVRRAEPIAENTVTALVNGAPMTWDTDVTAHLDYDDDGLIHVTGYTTDRRARLALRLRADGDAIECRAYTSILSLQLLPRATPFMMRRATVDACVVDPSYVGEVGDVVEGHFWGDLSVYDDQGFAMAKVEQGRFRVKRSADVGLPYCTVHPSSVSCR